MDMRPAPYAEFRFVFYARDYNASLQFYQQRLGLALTASWDRPDGRGALLSAAFGAVVEILAGPSGESAAETDNPARYHAAFPHIALRLGSPAAVDEAYRHLQQSGASLDEPPADRPWGHRVLIVRDPDGLPVHLYAELSKPAQDPPGLQR